jgi:uncharacterized coiled-coil DUF342 family protein
MTEGMPVYVRIDEYKDVLETIRTLKTKLDAAKETLDQISHLKAEEDAEIESWKAGLADIEQKVEHLDQSLAEPR